MSGEANEQIDPYLREFHPYKSLLEKPQNQATHYCETHDVKLKTAEELEAHDNCVILTDRQRSRRTNEGRRVSRRRLLTHVRALDEMLGSAEEPGYPPDDAVLIAGEPGCGKSTLCMWALSEMAHHGARVLYVSAEESAAQVLNRATTTGYYHRGMRIIGAKQIHEILPVCAAVRPHAIVIDSVSEMGVLGPYPKGGVRAVEAVANYAKGLATRYQALVMLVGHVTKANQIAGPKRLEHIVDATFQFSSSGARRDLYSEKNRFGPAKRTMHFEFRGPRLHACDDPTSNQLRDAIGRLGVVGFPFARNSDARLLPLEIAVSAPRSKEDGGTRTVWAQGFPTPMLRELAARLDDVENGCFFARSLRARLATLTPETVTDAALQLPLALLLIAAVENRVLRLAAFGELSPTGRVLADAAAWQRTQAAFRGGLPTVLGPPTASVPDGGLYVPVSTLGEAVSWVRSNCPVLGTDGVDLSAKERQNEGSNSVGTTGGTSGDNDSS